MTRPPGRKEEDHEQSIPAARIPGNRRRRQGPAGRREDGEADEDDVRGVPGPRRQREPAAVAYLDGYSKAGKLEEENIGEVDVDREVAVLVVACKQEPKKTLWDKIRDHLPGGKRKVKPTKMTCQEFVDLDQTVRPEAVYWAEGYDKAKKAKADELGEVDLERDVAVIYEECKQAPSESVWAKIKKHL